MSTKASYFLTDKNEHWYFDFSDNSITIEIDLHSIEQVYFRQDFFEIIIKKESCLYEEIKSFFDKNDFFIKIPYKEVWNLQYIKSESYLMINTKPDLKQNDVENYIIDIRIVKSLGK